MKFLIISKGYYPMMGPRALRTTELSKELARRGHEVVVYSLTGKYDYNTYEVETGVKVKRLGVSKWGRKDCDGVSHANFIRKVIVHSVGNYLWLPDRELIPMVKKAIREEGKIDCLITIAIPHVLHYAASLSDLAQVGCWIADCGDPFTLNPFNKYPKYCVKYEKLWCKKCDFITIPLKEAINGYYPEFHDKIRIIPQGFNFDNVKLQDYKPHNIPTFAYTGAVYKGLRDPSVFLQYLSTLDEEFRFLIFGKSWAFFEPYKQTLGDKLQNMGSMPHDEMITAISGVDFLINIRNNSGVQQPSKLIDYALSKRPFMTITSSFDDNERIIFTEFIKGNYSKQDLLPNIDDYNIVNVTDRFLRLTNL